MYVPLSKCSVDCISDAIRVVKKTYDHVGIEKRSLR